MPQKEKPDSKLNPNLAFSFYRATISNAPRLEKCTLTLLRCRFLGYSLAQQLGYQLNVLYLEMPTSK